MAGTAFRMFYGDRPATVEELAMVEEIVVEQEISMAWEARVRLAICMSDAGSWQRRAGEIAPPFARVRIEVKQGEEAFAPLIDGPVAGYASELSSQPGVSVANLVVRDDSVLMNREEETEVFDGARDSDLAAEMFGRFAEIAATEIQASGAAPPHTVKRGTPIQFVRELARANGFLGYVIPGDEPGASIGCFKPHSTAAPTLPPLVLFGRGRNLIAAEFSEDSEGPERTRAHTLRVSDQQVVSAERSFEDEALMGALPQVSGDGAALRELPPEENVREDPEARAEAQARAAAYALRMTANVLPGCYDPVLSPYRTVTLRAGDLPYSGDWLIWKVRHRIDASVYTQEIEARRNALSETAVGQVFDLASGGIF